MPKLQRSRVQDLNRYLSSRNSNQQNSPPIPIERFPKLEVGCCYRGKVVRFGHQGDPIVFQSSNNPAVILARCREPEIEVGKSVVYEVTYIGPKCAFGKLIEIYQT